MVILEGGKYRALKTSRYCSHKPPFSLFREYVDQLITHRKVFDYWYVNAISYKEIFKL